MSTLQTLDRGIQALEVVARRDGGISVAELAGELGVARAVCHRIVGTLAAHGFVARDDAGQLHLGAGLPVLAASYWPGVLSRARGLLQPLADRTGATSFLAVGERDEAVVLLSLDPTASMMRVGYRVGSRHPLTRGATGLAVRAARPAQPDDPEPVRRTRQQGYAVTHGELQPGAVGIAAPLAPVDGWAPAACVGVVTLADVDAETIAPLVVAVARQLC